jgi:hypothetical protein
LAFPQAFVRAGLALLAAMLAGAAPAGAQSTSQSTVQSTVDLQLVLAVDTSGSVSAERFALQQRGYAAAFRDPRLLQAIAAGARGAIAVTMVQWTGPALQVQVLPWTRIDSHASMQAVADTIAATPRQLFGGGTSISGAIDHAVALFATSGFASPRRIIDVSGDGANNRGRPAAAARDDALRTGIGINGLPILALEPDLQRYYLDNVIGGPGAFVVIAETYDSFAAAVLKKLVAEVAAGAGIDEVAGCRQATGQATGQAARGRGAVSRWRTTSMCWRRS